MQVPTDIIVIILRLIGLGFSAYLMNYSIIILMMVWQNRRDHTIVASLLLATTAVSGFGVAFILMSRHISCLAGFF